MNDSDQDFVDLCSKQLKRVRRKVGDSGQQSNTEPRQTADPDLPKKRRKKKEVCTASTGKATTHTGFTSAESSRVVSTTAEPKQSVSNGCVGHFAENVVDDGLGVAEKVLQRMQRFKRVSPQKLTHSDGDRSEPETRPRDSVPPPVCQAAPESSSDVAPGVQEQDEALALRLQEELDREARRGGPTVDLEDGGLFFCQLCHRDLSHMSAEGRTQHTNRCLDESEDSGPPPPLPPPSVPECPICGKLFKSLKSRSVHLKRCSSQMGVAPALLLRALHRQAGEARSDSSAGQSVPAGGSKRKGPTPAPGPPVRKKPRRKAPSLDEDTQVALALSSSLLAVEVERARETERTREPTLLTPLKWTAEAAPGRGGKRKKGAPPRPAPLLLVQDPASALRRLQERVAALLLRARGPSPPTPTRCPSTLPARSPGVDSGGGVVGVSAATLWRMSALQDGGPSSLEGFYTPELREFIGPWGSAKPDVTETKPAPPDPPEREGTPASAPRRPAPPPASQRDPSAPPSSQGVSGEAGAGPPSTGSQTLNDLMELADEGMTLTQWGYSASAKDRESGVDPEVRLSGFIPDDAHAHSHGDHAHTPEPQRTDEKSVALSRLTAELSSMVNNPQLSDVQLQVEDGEVFFAHSFMLYARCPLLAQMVHEVGFGVQEEGVASVQRVLVDDVSGGAVHALLQYLYTAHCPLTHTLLPHLQELASRFDLPELRRLCELHSAPTQNQGGEGDARGGHPAQEPLPGGEEDRPDHAFMELLRSMWNEDEDDEGGEDGGMRAEEEEEEEEEKAEGTTEDVEVNDERVNEDEMEEIYEFAATQRKRGAEDESGEEEEEEEEEGGGVSTHAEEEQGEGGVSTAKSPQLDPDRSLDRHYSRLFSDAWGVYEEEEKEEEEHPPSVRRPTPPHPSSPRPRPPTAAPEVVDLSISPLAGVSGAHPLVGVSPGEGGERRSARSPPPPRSGAEPELIVLSDSGGETAEVDSAPASPAPPPTSSSSSSRRPAQDFTRLRTETEPEPEPSHRHGSGSGSAALDASPVAPDWSPEVSWLVPATPVPPGRTSSSSGTQTHSSMRRTRLFPPKTSSSSSSSSSAVLPSPALSDLRTSVSAGDSAHRGRPRPPAWTPSLPLLPSSGGTPPLPHGLPPPHSSTPLHPAPPPAPPPPDSSPLLGALRLSLSDPSPSPGRGREGETGGGGPRDREGEEEGAGLGEEDFLRSFAAEDEPPIAFDDSWGPNGAAAEEERVCFSLRMDSTGGAASPPGHAREGGDTTGPSPFTPSPRTARPPSASPPPPPARTQPSSSSSSSSSAGPAHASPELTGSLLDSRIWDEWVEEEEEEEPLPLSQRLHPVAPPQRVAQLKTPVSRRGRGPLVPITPMPGYSDMDTPELKNKLNRFGVRPLPKRQMVLKLKEIHQYTHQVVSSGSEDEAPPPPRPLQATGAFKQPRAPPPPATASPVKPAGEEDLGSLSGSQGSNTSSTAASEDSERSNPELCPLSDDGGDSDGDLTSSQASSRLQDRLQAVRRFIQSDPELYAQVLQYQPLVLVQLQSRLKEAGIRLGAAKLVDFLDANCITFTTAKPAQGGRQRRRGGGGGRKGRGGGGRGKERGGGGRGKERGGGVAALD